MKRGRVTGDGEGKKRKREQKSTILLCTAPKIPPCSI